MTSKRRRSESASSREAGTLCVHARKARWVAIAAAIVLIAVFTTAGILLRTTPTGVFFRTSDQASMIGIGIVLGCGMLLLARPRVRADSEGIEVRNVIATQYFPWNRVLSVSFPDGAPWARLELPEDEYVSVMAVQATDGMHAVRAVRALRGLHRQARGDARASDSED